jgi:hypothetical protein
LPSPLPITAPLRGALTRAQKRLNSMSVDHKTSFPIIEIPFEQWQQLIATTIAEKMAQMPQPVKERFAREAQEEVDMLLALAKKTQYCSDHADPDGEKCQACPLTASEWNSKANREKVEFISWVHELWDKADEVTRQTWLMLAHLAGAADGNLLLIFREGERPSLEWSRRRS